MMDVQIQNLHSGYFSTRDIPYCIRISQCRNKRKPWGRQKQSPSDCSDCAHPIPIFELQFSVRQNALGDSLCTHIAHIHQHVRTESEYTECTTTTTIERTAIRRTTFPYHTCTSRADVASHIDRMAQPTDGDDGDGFLSCVDTHDTKMMVRRVRNSLLDCQASGKSWAFNVRLLHVMRKSILSIVTLRYSSNTGDWYLYGGMSSGLANGLRHFCVLWPLGHRQSVNVFKLVILLSGPRRAFLSFFNSSDLSTIKPPIFCLPYTILFNRIENNKNNRNNHCRIFCLSIFSVGPTLTAFQFINVKTLWICIPINSELFKNVPHFQIFRTMCFNFLKLSVQYNIGYNVMDLMMLTTIFSTLGIMHLFVLAWNLCWCLIEVDSTIKQYTICKQVRGQAAAAAVDRGGGARLAWVRALVQ